MSKRAVLELEHTTAVSTMYFACTVRAREDHIRGSKPSRLKAVSWRRSSQQRRLQLARPLLVTATTATI